MIIKSEWVPAIIAFVFAAGSFSYQVYAMETRMTDQSTQIQRIERWLGPVETLNVKQDTQIDTLIEQQKELNSISKDTNRALAEINGSIRELQTTIKFMREEDRIPDIAKATH